MIILNGLEASKKLNYINNFNVKLKTTPCTFPTFPTNPSSFPTPNLVETNKLRTILLAVLHGNVWVFPAIMTVLIPLMVIGSYLSSVYHKQLLPWFPYVSETAGHHPQAAFFSQCLDLGGLLMCIIAYYRYKQVKFYLQTLIPYQQMLSEMLNEQEEGEDPEKLTRSAVMSMTCEQRQHLANLNLYSTLICYASGLGYAMADNFCSGEHLVGHVVSVAIAFTGTWVYIIITIRIMRKLANARLETPPTTVRVFFAIGLGSLMVSLVASLIFILQTGQDNRLIADISIRNWWAHEKPGYDAYVVSTLAEWMAILSGSPMMACMAHRFWMFTTHYEGALSGRGEAWCLKRMTTPPPPPEISHRQCLIEP